MSRPAKLLPEELVAIGVEAAWRAIWPELYASPAPGEDFAPTLWRQVRAVLQATGERRDAEIREAVVQVLAFLDGKAGADEEQLAHALNKLRIWTATVSEGCE